MTRKKKRKGRIRGLAVPLIAVAFVVSVSYFLATSNSSPSLGVSPVCIDEDKVVQHIHAHLEVTVDRQHLAIPAKVGITGSCAHPIHTHDDSGLVHVESNVVKPYFLEDFLSNWGKSFDNYVFAGGTVNGIAIDNYRRVVLKDGQRIVLEFRSRG